MAEAILKNVAQFRHNEKNVIDVFSDKIRENIDKNSRITDANLILHTIAVRGDGFNVKTQSNGGDYDLIDYVMPSAGDNVNINITEELNSIIKNANEKVVIKIDEDIEFDAEIELRIAYIPERVMYESNTYCDVDAGRAGSGRVNVATGALNFVHSDSAASGIAHVYNTWQANKIGVDFDYPDIPQEVKDAIVEYSDYGCGKGWKLNVHQYLVKRKGTSSQDLYTFVDGNGNYHEFSEKYYYMSGEMKIYLDKKDVEVDFDGKLTYEGLEVKPELMTTGGYILRTDYKGFAGADKLELRSEDRAKIEEDIESLKRTISDCKFALVEYKKAETEEYKALMVLQERIENETASLERENLVAQDSIADIMGSTENADSEDGLFSRKKELDKFLRKNPNGKYQIDPGKATDAAQAEYDLSLSELQSVASVVATAQALAAEESNEHGASREQLLTQNQANSVLNAAQKKLNDAQKALNTKIELLQQVIREQSNEIERINWDITQELNASKRNLMDLQDRFRADKKSYNTAEEERQQTRNDELYARAEIDLKKASNLLEQREFELAKLVAQEPVRFISGGDGTIMGFNDAGVLMVVADAYENATYFFYEDGKLVSIKNTDNKETKFEYENGYLTKIIDIDEKVVCFDYYSNGMLAAILYPDGTSSDFSYESETGLLSTAINPSGYGIKFTYESFKIKKIEETTLTYEITDDGWRGFNGEEEEKEYGPRLLTEIHYNTHLSSTVKDRAGHKITYVFDIFGKPSTVYEGEYADHERNTKSVSTDYSGGMQNFSIQDNIMYENILARVSDAQLNGELRGDASNTSKQVYEINIAELPEDVDNFVFSAWVKADSAFVVSERKTGYSITENTALSNESDFYKKNRKFGLRAELEYLTERNVTEREKYYASFDWLNTDWQYLALPIAVREADKIGDRIVGKFPFKLGGGDRKLTKMTLFVDYSYNVNGKYDGTLDENGNINHTGLLFDCVTLREGDWTYSKIEPDGKVSYTEDSASGNTTFFEYDTNGNVIKETIKDKLYRRFVNTFEYNKQGALIRDTDYTGLCKETVYDDQGRPIKSMTYNISDPTSKFYSENVRDEKGRVTADVDITGKFNSVEYGFDHKGIVNVVKDANGGKTAFGYHDNEMVSVSRDCNGEENRNTLKHTLGYTTRVSSGETDYTYTYDGWGRPKAIAIAGVEYSNTEYIDTKTTKVCLASGECFTEYSDAKDDETVSIIINEQGVNAEYICKTTKTFYTPAGGAYVEQTIGYFDEEFGLIRRAIDKSGEIVYTTDYKYDREGRLTCKEENGVGVVTQTNEYDDKGGIKRSEYTINGVRQSYSYEYENAVSDRQVGVVLPGGTEQKLEYDGLGRVNAVNTNTIHADGSSTEFTKDIYYAKFGDHATKNVSSVWFGTKEKRDQNIRYTYDKIGNITSVKENGVETSRYAYDSLNRLIREDNKPLNKTEIYEYDNNGNLLARTRYAYTLKETPTDGVRSEYCYATDGWRDQLIGFNGEANGGYDALGNPWQYRGKQLRWEKGRNLVALGNETYTYNASGLRTSKTIGDVKTVYYLDGNKVIAEERRNKSDNSIIDALYYHYGAEGIAGFEYRMPNCESKTYIYRKNVNGDITHIYTANGELIAKYTYDAWGNHIVQAAEGYEELAARNAFRYRGYYYDITTKLFYLNSRYYDPETGRFINADAIGELDPEEINGLNLYAYCANNPVMMTDSEGNAPEWWQWLVSGFVIALGAVLCATGIGTGIGTGLIAAGGSMMASNIMSAAGVDGKIASIISSGLNIIAGVVLCATGIGGPLGASLIGSGVGAIGGGYISEAIGFGFEAGAMIGGIVGGIVGGQVYKGLSAATSKVATTATAKSEIATSASDSGKGFDTFGELKKHLGPAGNNKEWHHIVEQSQIAKSGFSPQQIHNTNNIMAIDKTIHRQISGFYSSKQAIAGGQVVRNWLAGQSFQEQYNFGVHVLKMFGVLT